MNDGSSNFKKGLVRFAGRAGVIVICRVIGSLLTLIYTFLFAKIAPAAEVGVAFSALSFALLLSVVATLNVETGSIRYLPLFLKEGKMKAAEGFVRYCRYVLYCTTGIACILGSIYALTDTFDGSFAPYLVAFIAAPIIGNARINSKHATALGLVLQGTLPRILIRPVLFTAAILFCYNQSITFNALQFMGLLLAASTIASILQWVLIRKAMNFKHSTPPDFAQRREWTVLGLMLIPMLLMGEYMRNIIMFSASIAVTEAEVAILAIALSVIGLLGFALTAVDMTVSPQVAKFLVNDKKFKATQLLSYCSAAKLATVAIGVPVINALLPFAESRLGADYAGVTDQFFTLALIPFAMAAFGPANLVMNVLGERRSIFWGTFAGISLLSVSVFICGTFFGIDGVIFAATGSMITYQMLQCVMCRIKTGINTTVLSHIQFKRQSR